MSVDDVEDNADEYKATGVLEQMLQAADVGAILQDYENWSTSLHKELKMDFVARGADADPKNGWLDNQMKFFDFYVLLQAKNLEITGVFCEEIGHMFVCCVKCNQSQWIEEGDIATNQMISQNENESAQMVDSHIDLISLQAQTWNLKLPILNFLLPVTSSPRIVTKNH
ncbi:LOW QUALITY PROTEIN: hypothetical protein HJC23_006739 [Cyclotella cryptica]|uniref:Uncharacterized protein n=1 Tax=Cyclotella cryptica TaxID=29204 RepID=A0ABD3PQ04_9STRA